MHSSSKNISVRGDLYNNSPSSVRGDLYNDSPSRMRPNRDSQRPSSGTAKDAVIDLDSDTDSEDDIQVTKVELSQKQEADILIREAIADYRTGKYEYSMKKLDRVFAIDPTNIMALVALGSVTYRWLDDSPQALKFLTRALEMDPNNMDAIIAKASILGNNHDLDGALSLLEYAVKMDPPPTQDSRYDKAKTYYCQVAEEKAEELVKKGNKQEAMKLYEKVLEVNPENTEVQNTLSRLRNSRRKASGGSVEVISLSSDEEDEKIIKKSPTAIPRSPLREPLRDHSDMSDVDQDESSQIDNSFNSRVFQFLQNNIEINDERNDSLVNQKKKMTDGNENGTERGNSDRESKKYEQNSSNINKNNISESHEFVNDKKNESAVRYDGNLERTVLSESNNFEGFNISEVEIPSTTLSEHFEEHNRKSCNDKNSKIIVGSLDNESTNNEITDKEENENTINKITDKEKNENTINKITDKKENENTINKITDKEENENTIKRNSKKRTLPKLTRIKQLPIGPNMGDNNSSQMNSQNIQEITKQQDCPKRNMSQSMENNLSGKNIIENETQCSGSDNESLDLINAEEPLPERENSYGKSKKNKKTKENKSEDHKQGQQFKETSTQDKHNTQNISSRDKNLDKYRENNEKSNKRHSREKKEISNNNDEQTNEKRKNKRYLNKSEKRSSGSSRDLVKKHSDTNTSSKEKLGNKSDIHDKNVKQVISEQKLTEKSKNHINYSQKRTNDFFEIETNTNDFLEDNTDDLEDDIEDELFGVKRSSLYTMEMDDFDLPDIDASISESRRDNFDRQKSISKSPSEKHHRQKSVSESHNINNDRPNSKELLKDKSEDEYDELNELQNELRKDLEQTSSFDIKEKKQTPENKNKKGSILNNVKSKKTCEFLERIRKENEKTEKKKNEISIRSTKEIKCNTATTVKSPAPVKEKDGRRAIILMDPIVPPSEIKKRRRRRNADLFDNAEEREEEIKKRVRKKNGDLSEDEETPKKKFAKKSLNTNFPSEAIAGPSCTQNITNLSTPTKHPILEVQTPTLNSSSSLKEHIRSVNRTINNKEKLEGPREFSKNLVSKALSKRHAAVRKEFKLIDETDIDDLAENIEAEVFKLFNKDTGKAYKAKFRELFFNISNQKNETLFRKILKGEISPKKLVKMDKNELASEELARWNEERNKKTLDAIVQTEREKVTSNNGQVILKTHKGELEIQNDYIKEALETLNELPEDLSIDLNIKSSKGNKSKKEKNRRKSSRR